MIRLLASVLVLIAMTVPSLAQMMGGGYSGGYHSLFGFGFASPFHGLGAIVLLIVVFALGYAMGKKSKH